MLWPTPCIACQAIMTAQLLVLVLAIAVVLVLAWSGLIWWLWNNTMPEAFGLKPIRFWIAFRLLLLALLFSGGLLGFHLSFG